MKFNFANNTSFHLQPVQRTELVIYWYA